MRSFILFFILFSLAKMAWANKPWGLGASFIHSQVNYKEPGVMSEKGALQGYSLEGYLAPSHWLVFQAQGKWLNGNLEYDGSTFSGTPVSQTTEDKITEYRALMMLKFDRLGLYTGWGQRYWLNDLVISYRRETTYQYMPIGFRYVWRPFYVNYETRHFLGGVNKSYMGDIGGGRHDVTMEQKSGKGYSVEAGWLMRISTFDLKFSFAYEYWGIDDSETSFDGVDTLVEPHNSTNSYIFSAGLYF
jgi:hypothetical protein